MLTEQFVQQLRQLSRSDNLQAMQLLVADLAREEAMMLVTGSAYTLHTPYGNEAAAQTLADHLNTTRR